MPFNSAEGPITIAPASPSKQKFFSIGRPFVSAPLSSPSSASSTSSMNSFFSNIRKVPRTIKNILTRTSTSSEGTSKPKKRSKLKPIDLFEPQSHSLSEEDKTAYSYLTAQPKQKKYSTNVDTKEYNLPIGSDRKKSSNPAVAPATKVYTTSKTLETFPQVTTPTTNDQTSKFTTELAKSETATTFRSSDLDKATESPIRVTSKTTSTEPLQPEITRTKHSSYYDELIAENDVDSISSSESQGEEKDDSLTPGERRWKLQRKAWLKPRPEAAIPPRASVIKPMSEAERIAVYKYLVVSNRQLREPMLLSDALLVLRSGWVASGQCPVFEIPAGTI